MATSPDFHILVSAKAREGTYQVRLYSLPNGMRPRMASVGIYSSNDSHWNYLKKRTPITLASEVLQTIAPQQIDAESELEQGNPRYASLQVDFLADPALQVVIQNMRDQTKDIWCEITLTQNINDAPAPVAGLGITWPQKDKLYFWGFIDRKSSKGKVNSQKLGSGNFVRQDSQKFKSYHNGGFSFVFFDWRIWSTWSDVKAMLDFASPTDISARDIMAAIMISLAPTDWIYVADQQMLKASLIASSMVSGPFACEIFDGFNWGKLSVYLDPGDGTKTDQLYNVYVNNGGAVSGTLWGYDGTKQVHSLTSDQDSTSLYHWNDLAQALTEWCREFFFNWQCELPTLEQAANAQLITGGTIDPRSYLGAARFLLLDISTTPTTGKPLAFHADVLDETLEYDPCGAWASSYTISSPGQSTNILPATPAVARSKFVGGTDESYTTLTRTRGWNNNTPPTEQPSGWDLLVPNNLSVLEPAQQVTDKNTGTLIIADQNYNAWATIHSLKKLAQWGAPRAIASFTSKGVGLEPYGESAAVNGKAITPPKLTYGLRDWNDFPLGRECLGLPGILATPGDTTTSEQQIGFSIYSIKRTPNGDTEVKMIELYSDNVGVPSSVIEHPPALPPPPPPPPPPNTGTTDPPIISFTVS